MNSKKSLTQMIACLLLLVTSSLTFAGSVLINEVSGFSDNTPVEPIGGNPGETIGEQRSNVFAEAASIWTGIISPNANITVDVQFATMFCNASGAVYAGTSVPSFERNFAGAINNTTWYPPSLKDHLTSTSSGTVMNMTFNSEIGTNPACLDGDDWYYGYDHNPSATEVDLLNIALHEIAHGLGFTTFVDLPTGTKLVGSGDCSSGCDDIYMTFLRDDSLNKNWPDMSNSERTTSATDTGDLVWTGAEVQRMTGALLSNSLQNGYPEVYAPAALAVGSSVNHWSTSIKYSDVGIPRELMNYTPYLPFDMAVTVALMRDLGWAGALYDFDEDSVDDATDPFPTSDAANADTDGDGMADDWLGGSGCSGATCDGIVLDGDDDGDGVQDVVDADPLDENNTNETDLPMDNSYEGLRYSSEESN